MQEPIWDDSECDDRAPIRASDRIWAAIEILTICFAFGWVGYQVAPHLVDWLMH